MKLDLIANKNFDTIILIKLIIIFLILSCAKISAQEKNPYQLDEVVVTASRIPLNYSELTRSVVIIDTNEIKQAPVSSLQDLLKYVSGIELKRRGVDGVQGDVSIRGGSSEETLIMIDGVKVSDPQTAHHNLNIPLSLDDVERIEILKGQGSHIFGPDAFGGVINIITKKGNERLLSLESTGGQNSYYDGRISLSYPLGILSNHISASRQKSDGYIHDSDFKITNFAYNSSLKLNFGALNLLFGYNDKKFGANTFYTDIFPNQWEHTTTKFLNFSGDLVSDKIRISPKIYWRRNDDDYLLDYTNPTFYENIHQSNTYGAELQTSIVTNAGTIAIGGEYVEDKLTSTNLGNHRRYKKGAFAEYNFSPVQNLTAVLGGFEYNYSDIGWKLWPGIDLAYRLSEKLRLHGSIGKAFRIPTYTELFYKSPTILGNPDLKPEETLNYETGINYTSTKVNAEVNIFRNEGKNIIDYSRMPDSLIWTARNIAEVNTTGFEINVGINPSSFIEDFPIVNINMGYTYINSDKKTAEYNSLYVIDYLRDQVTLNINDKLWFGIIQSVNLRYENRVNFEDNFTVDTKITKTFNNLEIFLIATNLFNKTYHEIGGVPLPGRWLKAGAKLNINL
jgi:vitamin B12 transporter